MHGLINKAIQSFITDSFGEAVWHNVRDQAGIAQELGPDGFEAMQHYDDRVTEAMLTVAGRLLDRSRCSLLEDLGTYLVSNPQLASLRRLLRFGGVSFTDFLYSLEDLPGRTRLAVPELALPEIDTEEQGEGRFLLICRACPPGFGHVMMGILRALADDYGALAVIEHVGDGRGLADDNGAAIMPATTPDTMPDTMTAIPAAPAWPGRPDAPPGTHGAASGLQSRRAENRADEQIIIEVYDPAFHSGRRFDLVGAESP